MSEWIEELEDYCQPFSDYKKGDLYMEDDSFFYRVEYYIAQGNEIYLKGKFTIDQLQDLVNHMKQYKGE